MRAIADYQRTNGVTDKEQFLAAYEANYKLNARLSYSWEHETDPPLGVEKTDTISRAALIYGF